ncbi:response regulator [Salegentibacter salegens]|uniref:Response regulator receiver domain-containing protein n=1 Tax=Salegentibacter salegens TaxID=143223 RepID=A0A1M7IUC0_9FLAO|nr:response regulator [Salegentibacter salegens]PRX49809.1 response regulator receiver domain-containing protein [Salegentibacter salegens]SHM44321.1 Response regulator receiver domain-containing protein [Salegentibacter salegens]
MESIHILLVEDNEGDILLTSEALEEGKILNKLSVVRDGKEAMDFLDKKGKYVKAITPDLILLDVNLPKMNGHEVLKFVKQHKDLRQIPVIMLTTSSSKEDIDISYQNYANCYITKPIEVDDFMNAVNQIEEFWVNLVKLPSK